ncbi:DUF4344 domain-containing metallopeptidase [Jannaschia sp. M317]|uniref:DUF4344 domain-containing metallopeptidase n=1 Tax=Jannaschia sp. M317 TaxID=2867011 RepID=UPI0021A7C407|nr:DUF4344 domain-containing metallopeptidase [Jannaschia sp. M317]
MKAAALLLLSALPVAAQDLSQQEEAFVEANILSVFYHELGHALIDVEDVPIFGQEEDAADVFAVVLTEAVFEPEVALDLAYDYALGFDAEARARAERGEDHPWWDVHGPDEQRFYNTVCLFYGADPQGRSDYAEDMGLPEERADYCPGEYEQAEVAWGEVLDAMLDRGGGDSLRLSGAEVGRIGAVLAEEVAALNAELQLAENVDVRVAPCDEANAFYDPSDRSITFCTEYEAELIEAAQGIVN